MPDRTYQLAERLREVFVDPEYHHHVNTDMPSAEQSDIRESSQETFEGYQDELNPETVTGQLGEFLFIFLFENDWVSDE
ncbi:uncharacterized protein I206_104839 [Kwoniella pini CBS 10737]|uniref:Uncharacterized protein n=1 Tax=Kwoniella pini CBS 10737 TaxID=1296096 RepID=A0AAJ8L697_9TREE